MSDADREKWNTRWSTQRELPPPSPFLVSLDPLLPRGGRALDVAGGTGRNAVWLAQRGLDVTLVDVSDVALTRAGSQVHTVQLDLETSPLPTGPWDVIVCIDFLHRPLYAAFADLLAPGGWLVAVHATRTNLSRNPHPGPAFLLDDGELPSLVRGLEIVRSEEGWSELGRHEARLAARKPQ